MEHIPETGTETNKRFVGWLNVTYCELSHFLEANPDRVNLMAVTKEISARWKLLSQEDCVAVTAGSMQEIEEEHEAKDLASHNIPLRAFYDTRSTVQVVETEVSNTCYQPDL